MLRHFLGALALACGVAQAFAGTAAPADDSGSGPMRFEWRREGPVDVCGQNCRTWISAVGYITADTPREFETFAKDPNVHGAVLALDSDGGFFIAPWCQDKTCEAKVKEETKDEK